ncbi:MAG: hypothetical protein JNJ71_03300 [Rubrivivax sp.]|nr:hypothetical protein [Rubrivivax sp.]
MPRGPTRRLQQLALARSGDKGDRATLSIIALDRADYPLIERLLSIDRVRGVYAGIAQGRIDRYALPQLAALHFVLHGALCGGVTRSLALDAHGKTLSSLILALEIEPAQHPGTSARA